MRACSRSVTLSEPSQRSLPTWAEVSCKVALQILGQEGQDDAPIGGRVVAFEVNMCRALHRPELLRLRRVLKQGPRLADRGAVVGGAGRDEERRRRCADVALWAAARPV